MVTTILNLNPQPTPAQRGYLTGLLRAAHWDDIELRRQGIDLDKLSSAQASALIDHLKTVIVPPHPIICRVCGEQAPPNPDSILLCPACLEDLDAARAKIEARRTRVFSDLDAAHERHVTVLDASEPAVQSWWEKILTKRSALDETESDALIERAWQAQGRATALIAAWRVWGGESAALGRELDALRAGQEEINLATLEQEGVL